MTGKEITNWGDKAMYGSEPMLRENEQGVRPSVYLLSATPDPLGAIGAMCAMYEGRVIRDLKELTDDDRRRYWEQVKKTHLKAPLEAVDLHFMIEGVTRSFTHQMVRQRTAVYAQESLRFAVKENLAEEIALPPSIYMGTIGKPAASKEQDIWNGAIEHMEGAYQALISMGVPAEDARGLLPHAVTTRLNYKTNLRNLVEHAGNRLCTQAQFEWRFVISAVVGAIRRHRTHYARSNNPGHGLSEWDAGWQWKLIADDDLFRPVCFAKGKCPFQADFDRGCTIRERADRGAFDEIDDSEWLLDPAAARRS